MLIPYPAYLREPLTRWTVRMRLSRLRPINPQPSGLTGDPGRLFFEGSARGTDEWLRRLYRPPASANRR